MLKIAHTCTNSRSGLSSAARDEVIAECKLGVDARLIFPIDHVISSDFIGGGSDAVAIADIGWALQANVVVYHSGLEAGEERWTKPSITIAHGNPYHCFMEERIKGLRGYNLIADRGRMPASYKVVTYWGLDVPYWEAVIPKEMVALVPLSINLDKWRPGEADPNQFGSSRGDINIVSTTRFRSTMDPFPAWNAFACFADMFPDKKVKLHIIGFGANFTGTPPLFEALMCKGQLGEIIPNATRDDLLAIYHSADMCITAHRTESLTVREAMACGCQVIGDITLLSTPYRAPVHDARAYAKEMARAYAERQCQGHTAMAKSVRASAERLFNPERTAKAIIQLCEEAIEAKRPVCQPIRPAGAEDKVTGMHAPLKTRKLKEDPDDEVSRALGRTRELH